MKTAALITALIAALSSLALAGVYRCTKDRRRHWYCIACILWGKQ